VILSWIPKLFSHAINTTLSIIKPKSMLMKKLRQVFANFACVTAFATVFFASTAIAQDNIGQQPAQGAQINHTDEMQQSATAPVASQKEVVAAPKAMKKVPQIVTPENATAKQAKKIAKVNEMLAKAAEQQATGEVKELNKVQKAAAQMALKKLTRKLDKMGVEETNEVKAIKDASAAKAVNNMVLIGIILLAVGLILLLIPGISLIGLLMFIAGLVLLILGLVQS